MHVAINALFLDPPMGGLETYARELCRALLERPDAPRLTVYLNPAGHEKLSQEPWAADCELVRADWLGRRGARAISELFALGPVVDRTGAQIVHSLAMTGPLYGRARRVVTIPDVIWITEPQSTVTQKIWRTVVPRVARRANEVIAIAETSRAEVAAHLSIPSEHLHLTLLGAGTPPQSIPTPAPELRARLRLGDGPIVLNVGQRGGHRNLERLVEAMVAVREAVPGAVLVLPGYAPPEADSALRARAAQLGLADAVHFSGFVSHEDLDGLYVAADAFVMPSLVEGFGLPVLEALQRGAPVACSRGTAPEEIAGPSALTFDPLSVPEIAAATVRLLTDDALRSTFAQSGPLRAAQYTWERCADQTMDVYRQALA